MGCDVDGVGGCNKWVGVAVVVKGHHVDDVGGCRNSGWVWQWWWRGVMWMAWVDVATVGGRVSGCGGV